MFFFGGCGERVKSDVHVALCGLALVCTAYNLIAWGCRRERHLAWNVAVYGAVAAFEVVQIQRHLEGR
jgi:hypothetical protein